MSQQHYDPFNPPPALLPVGSNIKRRRPPRWMKTTGILLATFVVSFGVALYLQFAEDARFVGPSTTAFDVIRPIIKQEPDGPHVFWFNVEGQTMIAAGIGGLSCLAVMLFQLARRRPRSPDDL
jgi:hypothetical protein